VQELLGADDRPEALDQQGHDALLDRRG